MGLPAPVMAQRRPAAGLIGAAGVAQIDGTGAALVTGGVTRSWGPVVAMLHGDLSVTSYWRGYPRSSVDPLNQTVYCGSRSTNNANVIWPADIAGVGGGLADLGIAFGPFVVSRGYRFSLVSAACFAPMVHGST